MGWNGACEYIRSSFSINGENRTIQIGIGSDGQTRNEDDAAVFRNQSYDYDYESYY